MTDENPYFRQCVVPAQLQESASRFHWRLPVLLLNALVASVPFYGYFVQAGRNSQYIAVVIGCCWLAGVFGAFGSVGLSIYLPSTSRVVGRLSTMMTVYLVAAGIAGWGGVRNAVLELLAG